jgi:catechol 2,3-dioxygenase-like lactoylglutathione lyase family enzyme
MTNTVTGILETAVYSDDLPAARQFYEQVLQLPLVTFEADRHAFFKVGRSMLLIFQPQATSTEVVTVGDAQIPQHGASGAGHFAFRVTREQLDVVRSRLAAADVAIESEIEWPNAARSIYFRDPAGNSVECATGDLWFEDERGQ